MSKIIPVAISGAVLLASGGLFGVGQATAKDIVVSVDGVASRVRTNGTVAEVLAQRNISVTPRDAVTPAVNTVVSNGDTVQIRYARPVTTTVDGVTSVRWTTGLTLDEALRQMSIPTGGAKVSLPLTTAIPRSGLNVTVDVAKNVTIKRGDNAQQYSLIGTVGDALRVAGIQVGAQDKVSPGLDAKLTEGMVIDVVAVVTRRYTKDVSVPYETEEQQDPSLPQGTRQVAQAGKNGTTTEEWEETTENGKVTSDKKVGEASASAPQKQVIKVGTKVTTSPASTSGSSGTSGSASSSGTSGSQSSSGTTTYTGSHAQWMAAAGIAASDYQYVELLIARESGWNPNAVNAGSGACGLVQALPCSKLGGSWNDPVVALRWGQQYVNERYGGWAGAWAHSQSYGWY